MRPSSRLSLPLAVALSAGLGLGCSGDKGDSGACGADEVRAADGLCYPKGDTGEPVVGTLDLGRVQSLSPVPDLPASPTNRVADDAAAALLGQRLFFDTGLSPSGDQSCASCHDPARMLSSASAELTGPLPRLAPPLVGAAWQDWAGWAGACDSAWCAAATALEAPGQLDGDRLSLARHIAEDTTLKSDYEAIFGELPALDGLPDRARPSGEQAEAWEALPAETQAALTEVLANVGKSWEAWMRQLAPGESTLDRYIDALSQGDTTGGGHLSDSAVRGLIAFTADHSCWTCHSGAMMADGFANLGLSAGAGTSEPDRVEGLATALASEFSGAGSWSDDPEAGAAKLTAAEEEDAVAGAVRVPGLRTTGATAPFMHDGRFATLDEVLRFYSELPDTAAVGTRDPALTPYTLSNDDIADLRAFLEAAASPAPDASLLQAL